MADSLKSFIKSQSAEAKTLKKVFDEVFYQKNKIEGGNENYLGKYKEDQIGKLITHICLYKYSKKTHDDIMSKLKASISGLLDKQQVINILYD